MTPFPRMCLAGWAKYLAMFVQEVESINLLQVKTILEYIAVLHTLI